MRRVLAENLQFRRLWAGQSISQLGDQVTYVALPLVAVLVLDASAAEMGVLTAAVWLPHLLLSIPVSVWADRGRHGLRGMMVAADLGRTAVLLSVPVAYWLDLLTLGQLIVGGAAPRRPSRCCSRSATASTSCASRSAST